MKYWIIIQDTRKGPLTAEEIAATETIARTTPVWHAGLEGWVTVADVDELLAIVQRREASPTVPPPSPVSISGSETAAGASRPQWHTPWGVPKPGTGAAAAGYLSRVEHNRHTCCAACRRA